MSDLHDAISLETVDTLKKNYSTFFGVKPKQIRKAWLVKELFEGLSNRSFLRSYLKKLPNLELTFVRECVFNYHGLVDRSRFKAKYGKFPEEPSRYSYYSRHELVECLEPFFYPLDRYGPAHMPGNLVSTIKQLVNEPDPDRLNPCPLPEPLLEHHVLFERERSVMSELHSLLILFQGKQIKVSEKTGVPSSATLKKVSKEIHEYYDNPCDQADGMEFIATYGWLRLLGNSKYSKQSKTALVPARKIDKSSADTIKDMWDQWVCSRTHDEFRRINKIKGQNGKGKRFFTDVRERRHVIIESLKKCKGKSWISFDDFSRYMFITGAGLVVTTEPEYLYIYGPEYGEFYSGSWDKLEARYLRCFLVEYAATLGLIDVVMAPPNSDDSYYDDYGDMECLSRYDGLRYFRLTSLGEYALGVTDHYKSQESSPSKTPMSIHRQGRIVFDKNPTPWEQRFLSLYADQGKGNVWNLSRKKIMEALQVGGSVDELQTFLQDREDQPFLPEDCESILKQTKANLDGVKVQSEALVISCKNQEIVELIINDKVLSKWCQRLGKLQIVVPKNKEKQLRENLNAMGIGCH